MQPKILTIRQSLDKAFLKVKPTREGIEKFKLNLLQLLDGLDPNESEEHLKNDVSDFLKHTYYSPDYYINTKGRKDLVIHLGKDAKTEVGVIIEAKKPGNPEMVRRENLNTKAFHELMLYFLRERIKEKNLAVKHLIITNIWEWFIFDAAVFDKLFAQDKQLVKRFLALEDGQLSDNRTEVFYKEIAKPFVEALQEIIPFTYFDIRTFNKPLRNAEKEDDKGLIPLFKILSPEHLLKLPFQNDSNSLDRGFYSEFLHLIGLSESKEGGKKVIGRLPEGQRQKGSLLELTIVQLDAHDEIYNIENPGRFGVTYQERLYTVALELCITWINRILFLKLLEAQLLNYHEGDKAYNFLSLQKVPDFDALDSLFFRVLARKRDDRAEDINRQFGHVPYLNSSLFEATELERQTIYISNLADDTALPLLSGTVIKDGGGKKRTGNLGTLAYLFSFLDAYDFSSEGSEDIQEDNKKLINASVLGLIFEKINGYKDGSFFTPGFITMYMCRETLRRAVMQKFNEAKGWHCTGFEQLYDKIEDKKEANSIINSLKVCDPAVGSGHFLVSALNELIAIKSELKILLDRQGKTLRDYHVEVVNDELVVLDEDNKPFAYHPQNRESQRVQEALFHEKQTIIENCLFGVDINPNSVKICRLRLWIELLKNAYYQPETGQLETLPNIDINIKQGNSLISRFALDADLGKALKKSRWNIGSYKLAVQTYRHAKSKEEKRELERLIDDIKGNFRSEINKNDKKVQRLNRLNGELFNLVNQGQLFGGSKSEEKARKKKQQEQEKEVEKLSAEIDEIKNNKIFEGAFEWRFEFPEVLDDEGEFRGFDAVIGNPPYKLVDLKSFSESERAYYGQFFEVAQYKTDLYHLFFERALDITKTDSLVSFIVPNNWMTQKFTEKLRSLVLSDFKILKINHFNFLVFDEADVYTEIILLQNQKNDPNHEIYFHRHEDSLCSLDENNKLSEKQSRFLGKDGFIIDFRSGTPHGKLVEKIISSTSPLSSIARASLGCQAYNSSKHTQDQIKGRVFHSSDKLGDEYLEELAGSDVSRYYHKRIKGQWIKYGPWLHDYRSMDWLTGPRILVREITGRKPYQIEATYLEETYCNYKTILNISPLQDAAVSIPMKYLCGILNSKLLSFIFSNISNKVHAGSFPRVSVGDLKILPIKYPLILQIEQEIALRVELLVTQVLTKRNEENQLDTSSLESEIDQLVYQLYGLTVEEIQLVEETLM